MHLLSVTAPRHSQGNRVIYLVTKPECEYKHFSLFSPVFHSGKKRVPLKPERGGEALVWCKAKEILNECQWQRPSFLRAVEPLVWSTQFYPVLFCRTVLCCGWQAGWGDSTWEDRGSCCHTHKHTHTHSESWATVRGASAHSKHVCHCHSYGLCVIVNCGVWSDLMSMHISGQSIIKTNSPLWGFLFSHIKARLCCIFRTAPVNIY